MTQFFGIVKSVKRLDIYGDLRAIDQSTLGLVDPRAYRIIAKAQKQMLARDPTIRTIETKVTNEETWNPGNQVYDIPATTTGA